MIAGALVEGLATCVIRIMSRSLCDTQIKYANVADAFFATALVVAGNSTHQNLSKQIYTATTHYDRSRPWLKMSRVDLFQLNESNDLTDTFVAFNFSGGYYNPVLATSLKYGCADSTFAEHLIVYWIGASIGSIASIYIYKSPVIQNCIGGLKQKTD